MPEKRSTTQRRNYKIAINILINFYYNSECCKSANNKLSEVLIEIVKLGEYVGTSIRCLKFDNFLGAEKVMQMCQASLTFKHVTHLRHLRKKKQVDKRKLFVSNVSLSLTHQHSNSRVQLNEDVLKTHQINKISRLFWKWPTSIGDLVFFFNIIWC